MRTHTLPKQVTSNNSTPHHEQKRAALHPPFSPYLPLQRGRLVPPSAVGGRGGHGSCSGPGRQAPRAPTQHGSQGNVEEQHQQRQGEGQASS
jgi:hypothetical protein